MGRFIYSTNNEEFRFDTAEEALECAWDDNPRGDIDVFTIYKGDLVEAKASDYAPTCPVESLGESAYDDIGEAADGWPEGTKEQQDDLEARIKKAVDEWADKHRLHPQFGLVRNIKETNFKMLKVSKHFDMADFSEEPVSHLVEDALCKRHQV